MIQCVILKANFTMEHINEYLEFVIKIGAIIVLGYNIFRWFSSQCKKAGGVKGFLIANRRWPVTVFNIIAVILIFTSESIIVPISFAILAIACSVEFLAMKEPPTRIEIFGVIINWCAAVAVLTIFFINKLSEIDARLIEIINNG